MNSTTKSLLLSLTVAVASYTDGFGQDADELFTSRIVTPINSFTSGAEGPAVDKKGNLYAVNFASEGTIGMVKPDGKASLFVTLPEGSIGNGIRFNTAGAMFIADYTRHNILRVDMKRRKISVHAHEPSMAQPNDIAIDQSGRLYASDPNWKERTGSIWRIDTDGKVTLLEGNMGTTNGIEVSPNQKTLFVTHQRQVLAYDLTNGEISNKRVIHEFKDFGMDGMRCDIDGNLYITRPGKGTVIKMSPRGEIIREIALIGKKPSNIAFGGKDGRTAYITMQDQGNVEAFRVDQPGREWSEMRGK